jgi:hypothetical protein
LQRESISLARLVRSTRVVLGAGVAGFAPVAGAADCAKVPTDTANEQAAMSGADFMVLGEGGVKKGRLASAFRCCHLKR